MIVTVTLNAAVDRTLTVPNFQLGHRHRASASLTSAGGKGINVARALKRLDSPVIATGLAGGRTGRPDHRGARGRGDPQRLRPHRRRVAHVDRRRRSDRGHADRDLRVGAGGAPRGARHAARQAALPLAGRHVRRLLRLAAARRRRRLLRGGDSRPEPSRRFVRARHRGRAAALRRRSGAVPRLAEPARGGEPRRPGVLRRRRLRDGARRDRRPGRAQRADHAGDVVLRRSSARSEPRGASAPRSRASSRSLRSARATSCSPASSPRASTSGRSTRRCGRRRLRRRVGRRARPRPLRPARGEPARRERRARRAAADPGLDASSARMRAAVFRFSAQARRRPRATARSASPRLDEHRARRCASRRRRRGSSVRRGRRSSGRSRSARGCVRPDTGTEPRGAPVARSYHGEAQPERRALERREARAARARSRPVSPAGCTRAIERAAYRASTTSIGRSAPADGRPSLRDRRRAGRRRRAVDAATRRPRRPASVPGIELRDLPPDDAVDAAARDLQRAGCPCPRGSRPRRRSRPTSTP